MLVAGSMAAVLATAAFPQGNIDAGKTPAQMFADTCSNCHRRPQELRRATASFLRQHYTPGAQEAAAMANYLAGIPADPRAKERPKAQEKEKERARVQPPAPIQQPAQERLQVRERLNEERPNQERVRVQPAAKAKRPEVAKSPHVEPSAPEAPPSEVRMEARPAPKLEPFEE
jgi:hypothetical protein